jgi:predicted phage tail protein
MLTDLSGKQGLPPAVSYLTATALLFGIYLKWAFPAGAEDTQRTEIWYGPTTSLEAATKLTDLSYPQSDFSMLGLRAGVTFFFWARLVDRIGNIGPWYPLGIGVMGQSSSEAAPVLDLIAGQIDESHLGQNLKDKIELIEGLQEQIDALDGLKAYVPGDTYTKGQMVVVDGRIYQAEQDVPVNTPPPNLTYWKDVGDLLETANGLAQQVQTNTTEISELDGIVTAQASALQVLRAAARDDNGEGELADALKGYSSTASIVTEAKVAASANEATAKTVTQLTATVGENVSQVTDLRQVVTNVQSSTATAITQLTASVNSANDANAQNTAAIQQTASAYADTAGKLTTMWSVKMQITAGGQYVAAGIGLGIENTGAGLQSQFLVSADRFAIVNSIAGGAVSVPFAVQKGQVFMNSAFIQDGTITNAKIGSYISSTNYIAGQLGWILNKDGTFEINSPLGGGGRQVINSFGGKVFDANGVKRYQWGNLDA